MLIKILKHSTLSIISIRCSSNNTIIHISDLKKKTIFSVSCGGLGIKGSRRSTSYANQTMGGVFAKKLLALGIKYVIINIKGFGNGRYSCIKGFSVSGIKILRIQDSTFLPFGGCKLSKKRRV